MAKRESEVRFQRSTAWVVLEGEAEEARVRLRAELDALLEEVNADLNKRAEGDASRAAVSMDQALVFTTTAMEYLRVGAPLDALPFAIMGAAAWALGAMTDEAYVAASDRALAGLSVGPLVIATRHAAGFWRGLHPHLQTVRLDRWGKPVTDKGKDGQEHPVPANLPACCQFAPGTAPMAGLVASIAAREVRKIRPARKASRPPAGPSSG